MAHMMKKKKDNVVTKVVDRFDDPVGLRYMLDKEYCFHALEVTFDQLKARDSILSNTGRLLVGGAALYLIVYVEGKREEEGLVAAQGHRMHVDYVYRIMYGDVTLHGVEKKKNGTVEVDIECHRFYKIDACGRCQDVKVEDDVLRMTIRGDNDSRDTAFLWYDTLQRALELYPKEDEENLEMKRREAKEKMDILVQEFSEWARQWGRKHVCRDEYKYTVFDNVVRIFPLCESPGWIALSPEKMAFSFMPYCTGETAKIGRMDIQLGDVKAIRSRKCMVSMNALEIYYHCWELNNDVPRLKTLFISFDSTKLANYCRMKMLEIASIPADIDLSSITKEWRIGAVSNFEYLMYLNDAVGRSFNNISQYPVFPWVIADYESSYLNLEKESTFRDLSRPIAAISPTKLRHALEMYASLKASGGVQHPWMFGSHYSNPGSVVFYKVRKHPELMLRLQGRKFDSPDRIFYNISAAWESVSVLWGSDVKELIPEFYDPEGIGLLENSLDVRLGTKSNGTKIDAVILPPWASDAKEFITKQVLALESDMVSKKLHKWIDLVFGVKSRGKLAEKYHNVFYYMTYDEMYVAFLCKVFSNFLFVVDDEMLIDMVTV